MKYNPTSYRYPSQRNLLYSNRGMVATGQPFAALAGAEVLKQGGNAIDAAVATAATLPVVEPTANGIGGDAFALIWYKGKLYGINASGPAPMSLTIEAVKKRGYTEIPKWDWEAVTVPGAPSAWSALTKRFGNLSLKQVMAPAIGYAKEGFPVTPNTAIGWEKGVQQFKTKVEGEQYRYWFETFAPEGVAPKAGEMRYSPDHAATLEEIANSDSDSFYKGVLADKIVEFSQKYGGYLTKEDLAAFQPEWVDPISVNYRGYDIWEIPPNGHGIVALMALNILKGFDFTHYEDPLTIHRQAEAIKLAFTDAFHYVADSRYMKVTPEQLLSEEYAAERRAMIGHSASVPTIGTPPQSGTVYLATADSEGNMVSYIQSNYMGFGSGLVVPGTGIALHNRGNNFTLDESLANCLAPGKRPYHTIIPGFMTKNNRAVGPFGVMGGFMQPQGHVQVAMHCIDFGHNPQEALDAPRWQWTPDNVLQMEKEFSPYLTGELERRGHNIVNLNTRGMMGRGQIIQRCGDGNVLVGATEPRTDGYVAIL